MHFACNGWNTSRLTTSQGYQSMRTTCTHTIFLNFLFLLNSLSKRVFQTSVFYIYIDLAIFINWSFEIFVQLCIISLTRQILTRKNSKIKICFPVNIRLWVNISEENVLIRSSLVTIFDFVFVFFFQTVLVACGCCLAAPQFNGFNPNNPFVGPGRQNNNQFGQQNQNQFAQQNQFGQPNQNQFGQQNNNFPNQGQFDQFGGQQQQQPFQNNNFGQQFTTTTPAPISSTTPTQAFFACMNRCPTTSQYNPVCGSDNTLYNNDQKLNCANICGRQQDRSWQGEIRFH